MPHDPRFDLKDHRSAEALGEYLKIDRETYRELGPVRGARSRRRLARISMERMKAHLEEVLRERG